MDTSDMDTSSSDEEWDPNYGVQPITRTYEILNATEGSPKPFYIYKFDVWKAQRNSRGKRDTTWISNRVRKLVLKGAIDKWLAENQPEDNFYHVPAKQQIILAQFAFQSPVSADDQEESSSKRKNFFKGQITIKNPVSIDARPSPLDETYNFCFSSVAPPVIDIHRSVTNWDVRDAVVSMILAGIEQDEKFATTELNTVHKFAGAEDERRTISLSPYLRMILGLRIKIEDIRPRPVEGEITNVLKIREEWDLFFEPVNMVELLREHYEFDITRPLERDQIYTLKHRIERQTVEMRVKGSSSEDEGKSSKEFVLEDDITRIRSISTKTVADEPNRCEWHRHTNEPTSEITVEEQFRREFPDIKLEYTHLPCVITTRCRKIPMEVCWIKPCDHIVTCASLEEMSKLKQLTYDERMEIFDENCRELLEDYGATSRRFGLELRPA